MRAPPLILDPSLPFADLDRQLGALGWRRTAGPSVPPLVPGEPEVAGFRHPDGATRLSYTYSPVVGLRVLTLDGPDRQALVGVTRSGIPQLADDRIIDLLRAAQPRELLLGIFAATERRLTNALPMLADLAAHPAPPVAKAAARARRTLAGYEPAAAARDAFATTAAARRQAIRRLGQTGGGAAAEALRRALADPDLEVRASAVLLTARCRLAGLLPEVAQADLVGSSPPLPHRDRRLLEAMRRAAIASLRGLHPPEAATGAADGVKDHVWRCALGLPVTAPDDILLIAIALTEPLDLPPLSETGPLGRPLDGAFRLPPLTLRFRRVASIGHWLGHDRESGLANPIRRWAPPSDALLAERPLNGGDLAALGVPVTADPDQPAALTAGDAAAVLTKLSTLAGTPVDRPSADLLEAGLRGPDGRRYPGGALPKPADPAVASPWGLTWVDRRGEWTADRTPQGQPVIAATDRTGHASFRMAGAMDDRYLLRPTIPIVTGSGEGRMSASHHPTPTST